MSPPEVTLEVELSGLALACSEEPSDDRLRRALRVAVSLEQLGVSLPLVLVYDLVALGTGPALAAPAPPAHIEALGLTTAERASVDAYAALLAEAHSAEAFLQARAARLPDTLLTVLVLELLGPRAAELSGPVAHGALGASRAAAHPTQLVERFARYGGGRARPAMEALVRDPLRFHAAVENLDVDALRLLASSGTDDAETLDLADLLAVLESPDASEIVRLSVDLLPSLLETKRAGEEQSFSVDGYAGLSRRGSLDALLFSELALPDSVFAARYVERELFYHAYEREPEERQTHHYVLVDASASMRGRRAVFARAVALTITKKLLLSTEALTLRFFDARLYEPRRATRGRGGAAYAAYLLGFRGERGRNCAKVFDLLAHELERVHRRDPRRLHVYILTHAECHIPRPTVERLARHAALHGVFLLPSAGALDLDYLDLFASVQVVDDPALSVAAARHARALDIVSRVGE